MQERFRLLDSIATRCDARESARQRISALAGASQKGCAGKTAEEVEKRALLCRQAARKLDAATVRRLATIRIAWRRSAT